MRNITGYKTVTSLRRAAVLALAAAGLAGCVYYPSGYGYGRGSGYYAPAVTVAPPPIVFGGWWGDDDDD